MLTLEKIVDLIKEGINYESIFCNVTNEEVEFAAERILAMSAPQWVSVEDDLPEDNLQCIWCTVPIQEPPWVGSMCDTDFIEDYYTHWMLLENSFFPTPPQL